MLSAWWGRVRLYCLSQIAEHYSEKLAGETLGEIVESRSPSTHESRLP